jgi:hypothetical protein
MIRKCTNVLWLHNQQESGWHCFCKPTLWPLWVHAEKATVNAGNALHTPQRHRCKIHPNDLKTAWTDDNR